MNIELDPASVKLDSEYHQTNDYSQLTKKGYELLINLIGSKYYFLDGLLHRENAPAIIHSNGYQAWLIHNKRHRLNGPTIIYSDGTKQYWIDNKEYEENEFWTVQKKCFKCHQIFSNLYELKIHLEQYDDSRDMIEYIFKLLL